MSTLLPQPPQIRQTIDFDYPEQLFPIVLDLFKHYGDIYTLKSNQGTLIYVINHPQMVSHVLGKNHLNYCKGVGINRVNVLLGQGLMVSEGDLWKRQRRMLQPMFHSHVLERLTEYMIRGNENLLLGWQQKSALGEPINLTQDMGHLALDFILHALISEDLERLTEEMGGNPFSVVTTVQVRNLDFARRFRALTPLIRNIIQTRRIENRWPDDWLSMLVAVKDRESGQPIPEKLLIDEILTLIIAGHETTASALNWCWYLITQHEVVEQSLVDEVDHVLNGRTPGSDDLKQLTRIRQVLYETMRLYPPGWLMTRRALNEDEIAGYPIAAGTDIFISPYVVHRHPDFWTDPEVFRPQRFSAQRPQGAYLAFSMGPRNCIGENLAMQEMIVHLACVLQRVRLRLVSQQPVAFEAQVNLRPKDDLFISVIFR